ncbi:MAG: endonuclease/exonuclease/phosphatase family protein, partial [Planctomycetota bacterium]
MYKSLLGALIVCLAFSFISGDANAEKPTRSEVIQPIRNATFNKNGTCRERKQGGNPRKINGLLVFDGSTDGNRQVDPQIAIGGGYILHGTNSGLVIYNKQGEFVQGVSQRCFNGGIDPKMFFDRHNGMFGFDLWNPWDKAKQKPVNISVSETNDPTGAWNTYPVPAPGGRDGGGIGYSRKWIGYTFPGGSEQTFVMKMAEAKAGKPATVYHFAGNLGHPVATQDTDDDLLFVKLTRRNIEITRVTDAGDGTPETAEAITAPHNFEYFGWPPASPQKGTDKTTASGDRRPKNLVVQGGYLWFSQTVNCEGRAAVQWHQLKLDGTFVQSGRISDPKRSFIETTLAVNKRLDVLVGFQETGPDMFISPRFAYRRANDPPGTLRPMVRLGEGKAATEGGAWGDYSGSVVDADNMLDLWTIQSIADETGRGDTVIARLPADDPKELLESAAATAQPDPVTGELPTLRVLTYNIHHGQGTDGKFDYDRIAKIISGLQPDVVALQEVDRGTGRASGADQVEELAKRLRMHSAFGNALHYDGGEYGEAILSRFPMSEVKDHHLPFRFGNEPRTALAVHVTPDNGLPEFLFAGTHLCHQSNDTRTDQTKTLQKLFGKSRLPVILAGDFNARPKSEPMKVLFDAGWVDTVAPDSRIDYVLIRKSDDWKKVSSEVLDEPVASDHD